MSTAVRPLGSDEAARGEHHGSLLRAEALRLWSRRLLRVLLALAALGLLGGVALASTQYAKPSPAVQADAERRLAAAVAESEAARQGCLDQGIPDDFPDGEPVPTVEEFCGPPVTAENFGGIEQFIDKRPFELADEGANGLLGVAGGLGALGFLLGATYVGAEWSTRSMVALLFWEPRRYRVMAVKLLVLAGALAAGAVVVQAAWLGAAQLLAQVRGTGASPDGVWGDLLAGAGRGVLLVVLAGLLGFGVANLLRNTGAALGAGFLYFAFVENVVRVLRPAWQEWLLSTNVVALLRDGGVSVFVPQEQPSAFGDGAAQVVVGNLHGGLVLAAVVAAVVAAGVVLFARRDLG